MLAEGAYGNMVALEGTKVVKRPLSEVAGALKTVPPDHRLISTARGVQTCFGDV